MIRDDRDIVAAVRAALAERLGSGSFSLWLDGARFERRDNLLAVHAPSRLHQDYVRKHFRAAIVEVWSKCLGIAGEVEIACEPASCGEVAVGDSAAAMGTPAEGAAGQPPAPANSPSPSHAAATTPSEVSAHRPPHAVSPASRIRRAHALSRFVPGDSNSAAWSTVRSAAEEPARVPALFLYGPTSVGKTHLLEGLYHHALGSRRPNGAVFLTAEQFTSQYIDAVRGGRGVASFQRKCRSCDLLVIDDIQFMLTRGGTLGELVRTIDALTAAGRQIALSADRSPQAFRAANAELASRLAGAAPCQLHVPEFPTRLAIVRQWAEELAIDVPDDVARYVATHFSGHARELIGAMKRLRAVSLAHVRPITLALAEEALADLVHGDRVVRLEDVAKAVCAVLGLEQSALVSKRKSKDVHLSRVLAMFLARKYTRAPLTEIGQFFGRRSHATVISAQRTVEGWMTTGGTLQVGGHPLRLEETIRRVESQLRVG